MTSSSDSRPLDPYLEDGERQAEKIRPLPEPPASSASCPLLGQPNEPAVLAEVVVPQLGMAIKAELAQHGSGGSCAPGSR